MEKYGTARQAADDKTAHKLFIQAKAKYTPNLLLP
jgi:hypothetical protein